MDSFNSFVVLCFLSVAVTAFSEEDRSSKLHTSTSLKRPSHVLGDFPWHVFMSAVKCSGVFVHERWILSSASCVQLIKAVDGDQRTVFIRVGNHHVDLETPGEDTVPVLEALVYPKYNANTASANFGLLYLARNVILPNDQRASRINLPSVEILNGSMSLLDRPAKITGWGHLSGRKSPLTTLAESEVSLIPGHDCIQRFTDDEKRELLDESWCVLAGTKGMCSVDQGSPVVIKQNNSWVVFGIYTHGETCSSDKDAALFSRIDSGFLEWIQKLFAVGDKPRCQPSGHRVLDTPARALSSKADFDLPLCDNNLEEAWYKLEIDGIPAEIPTSCPAIGSCGTHAQIWMQPEGHPEFGEERNGSACVAWEGVERLCCLWQLPVHVTHCGGFLVYHLKRTEECSMAYCAKEAGKVSCGPGKIGYAPRCKARDPYPTLVEPPQITPVVPPDNILASESIHLLCTYDITDPGPFQVGYKVTWYKIMRFLGGKPGKLVLLTNTTEETAVVANFGTAEFYLGDTVVCEVMAFFLESPELTSPGFSSEDFYVGIKVEPSSLAVSEDHKIREITLSLTVPLICPPDHPNCTIQVSLHLAPAVHSPRMLSASDVALSTCEVTLKPQSCSRRDCGRKVVRLAAVSDFIDDGDRRTRIITEPARSQSPLWKSHDPADVFVLSKDVRTPRCHLFTESYIQTLAGRYYRIPSGVTTFVLYKSTARPFEVQARFWACSKSRNPGFCACGVAARDGDDVIVIDMCSGRFMETSVQISIRSKLPLAKGIRITEAISGKRYTVYFPSGVYVRADVFEWGLNVQVQSSGRDVNHVTGLCGLRDVSSSFQTRNEGLPPEMNGTQQWRFPDEDSLFHYKPLIERHHQTEKLFCLCSLNDSIEKKRKCSACESKCRRHQHVLWPVVSRERDITRRVQSLQEGRALERRHNLSDEFNPLQANPSDQPNLFDVGKPDTLLAVLAVISYCKRLLTDTPLGKACNAVLGQQNVDKLLKICIRDMRYTGVSSMVWGAAAMLQDSCEGLVMKNTSAWEMSSSTNRLTPPKSIKNVLCPRLCNDRGRCIDGTCKCRRGYTSDDCSVPSKSPPQLISVQNGGECDMRAFLCKHVRVVGEGFHNSKQLMCSLAEITEAPFETRTFLSKATYESFRGVTCEVPMSHDTDGTLSSYQIRVSNDGNLWSQPVPLFIFDGHCLTCTSRGMGCEIKNGTCRIDGRCRRNGETNPQDPCQWCSPKNSQQNWTDIHCQIGTCEAATCVHGVCLDTTMGRYFCFCDTGFTGPNCSVPENSCIPNPCGNGTCVQLGSTFRCECPPGYASVLCSDPINPCSSNPCNNGSCVTNGTHFGCFCDDGFTGPYCNIESCLCRHGRCVLQAENYDCVCDVGFTGKFCEVRVDDTCTSLPCKNGSCVEKDGDTKCLCDSGYTGNLCDIKTDPCLNLFCTQENCASIPCQHDPCSGDNYNFTCVCELGFTGAICHTTINITQESLISDTVSNVTIYLQQNSTFNFTDYNVRILVDGFEKIARGKRVSLFDDKELVCHGNVTIIDKIISCQDRICRIDENMLLCMLRSTNTTCGCAESAIKENCSCSLSLAEEKSSKNNPCKQDDFSCKCFDSHSRLPCDEGLNNKALSKGFVVDCFNEHDCKDKDDLCYPNPCVYGKCTSSEGGIQCVCEKGYTGKTCNETLKDYCQPNPCTRGECQNTENGFRCVCPKRFGGLTCNQTKPWCSINLCSHGECFLEANGELSCECFPGYQGPLCETPIDRCQLDICNYGLCINTRTGFRCLCLFGFSGKRCHVKDFCFPNPCVNGNCTSKSGDFHCVCHNGYTGNTCNETINHCLSKPCVRGQCLNTRDTYLCQCPQGFIGDTCNKTVNFCISNPCLNGDCINLESSFKCECRDGFQGILCDKQVVDDPCEGNPCSNGRCVRVQAVVRIGPLFYCSCDEGFTGQFCQSRIDPCKNSPCKHGLCVATDTNRFQCKCFKGFQGSKCDIEINHCASSPCRNGSCIPKDASFECLCHPGYQGSLCDEAVDRCRPNPCKHGSCQQGSTSFQCSCYAGYTGNVCETKIDHCGLNPCKHGVCMSRGLSFKCYCKRGYSGEYCQQKVNPCSPNPCKHGSCLHRYSSWFACRCELGYTGKMCDKKINMCQSQPCKNGVCINFGMSFRCSCDSGFRGRLCDKIETCQSQPCKRGKCISTANSYTCRCPETYTGRHCENKIDPCHSSPCKHGRCIPVNQSFRCHCNERYTGENCQVSMDPCTSHKCKNGRCIAQGGQYACQCLQGFSGKHCDTDIDECLASPCFSGVNCTNYQGKYSCGPCPVGFTGDGSRCEKITDSCKTLNCLNGKCIGQGGHYACQCLQGFSGKHCETDINECLDSPCFPGVDCTNYLGSYSCGTCPVGFTGDGSRCEKIVHPCERLNCFKDVPCVQNGQAFECGNCPRGFTGNGVQCTEMDACLSNPCHPLAECFTLKGSPEGFRCGPCPAGYKGNGINCTSLCPLPCPYGMECIGYYTCRCPEGFQGVGCKTPFCRAGCYNGGTCVKPNVCKCTEGFEGPACLSPLCQPPCRYGGKCIGPGTCRCSHGFIGSRCEKKRCLVTCLNGGKCIGPYVCQCMPGYSGQRCEIAPCTPGCQNGGLCIARDVCKCPPEYMGERCQYPLCRPPCINDGHCVRPNVCMCPATWQGDHCQKPVCHLPCLNGGRCARPNQCTCLSGYEGTMCEKAICNQPCLNGGQCVRPGVCACPFGFTGRQCEQRDQWYNNRKHEN